MDKEAVDFLIENKIISKGNPWLVSLKAVPMLFLFLTYVNSSRQISALFGIKDTLEGIIFILIIPSIFLYLIFKKQLFKSYFILFTYPKEFMTILFLFTYILSSLRFGFGSFIQSLMIGTMALALLFTWKNEIFNKIRKNS